MRKEVAVSLVIVFGSLAASAQVRAQTPEQTEGTQMQQETTVKIEHTVNQNFLLYLPEDYEQQEKVPLMLFLHGAGERGDNQLDRVSIHGPPKLIKAGRSFPCIVVSPQCPENRWWEPLELSALLDYIEANYKVDSSRIYVTGLSMGGYGTWALAQREPERFAAIAPVCGGGNSRFVKHSGPWTTPVWAFHGAIDSVVPANETLEMASAIREKGVDIKLTIYSDVDHNSWDQAYETKELYEWMFAQKRDHDANAKQAGDPSK